MWRTRPVARGRMFGAAGAVAGAFFARARPVPPRGITSAKFGNGRGARGAVPVPIDAAGAMHRLEACDPALTHPRVEHESGEGLCARRDGGETDVERACRSPRSRSPQRLGRTVPRWAALAFRVETSRAAVSTNLGREARHGEGHHSSLPRPLTSLRGQGPGVSAPRGACRSRRPDRLVHLRRSQGPPGAVARAISFGNAGSARTAAFDSATPSAGSGLVMRTIWPGRRSAPQPRYVRFKRGRLPPNTPPPAHPPGRAAVMPLPSLTAGRLFSACPLRLRLAS